MPVGTAGRHKTHRLPPKSQNSKPSQTLLGSFFSKTSVGAKTTQAKSKGDDLKIVNASNLPEIPNPDLNDFLNLKSDNLEEQLAVDFLRSADTLIYVDGVPVSLKNESMDINQILNQSDIFNHNSHNEQITKFLFLLSREQILIGRCRNIVLLANNSSETLLSDLQKNFSSEKECTDIIQWQATEQGYVCHCFRQEYSPTTKTLFWYRVSLTFTKTAIENALGDFNNNRELDLQIEKADIWNSELSNNQGKKSCIKAPLCLKLLENQPEGNSHAQYRTLANNNYSLEDNIKDYQNNLDVYIKNNQNIEAALCCAHIANNYCLLQDRANARKYIERSRNYLDNNLLAAKTYVYLANIYLMLDDHKSAAEVYELAAEIYKNKSSGISNMQQTTEDSDYVQKSIKNYYLAAKYFESAKDEPRAIQCYGLLLEQIEKHEKINVSYTYFSAASDFFEKLFEKANNVEGKIKRPLSLAGRIYKKLAVNNVDMEPGKAASYYVIAAKLFFLTEKEQDEIIAAECYKLAADIYKDKINDLDTAKAYYIASAEIYAFIAGKTSLATDLIKSGDYHKLAADLYTLANYQEKAKELYESARKKYSEFYTTDAYLNDQDFDNAMFCEKQAEVFVCLNDNASAGKYYDLSAEHYDALGNKLKAANCYEKAAKNYAIADDKENAANCYEKAAKNYAIADDKENAVKSYEKAAKNYVLADDKVNAAKCYEEAANSYVLADDKVNAAKCYEEAANSYVLADDKVNAAKCYEEAANNYVLADDKVNAANCYEKAAENYNLADDKVNAAKCYEKAAKNYALAGDKVNTAKSYEEAAKNYALNDATQVDAAKCYKQAADILKTIIHTNPEKYEFLYTQSAKIYSKQADILSKKTTKPARLYDYYKSAADCYKLVQNKQQAEENYKKAVDGYRAVIEYCKEKNLQYAKFHENIAEIYSSRSLNIEAGKDYEAAAVIYINSENQEKAAECYEKAAGNYSFVYDTENANKCYEKAAENYQSVNKHLEAVNCYQMIGNTKKLGEIYAQLGNSNEDIDPKGAADFYVMAAKHFENEYKIYSAEYYKLAGDTYKDGMQNFETAKTYYMLSAQIYISLADECLKNETEDSKIQAANYYNLAGDIYKDGMQDFKTAKAYYMQSARIYISLADECLENETEDSKIKAANYYKLAADSYDLSVTCLSSSNSDEEAADNYEMAAQFYLNLVNLVDKSNSIYNQLKSKYQENFALAAAYYKKISDFGRSAEIYISLADECSNDKDEDNKIQAAKYYKLAADIYNNDINDLETAEIHYTLSAEIYLSFGYKCSNNEHENIKRKTTDYCKFAADSYNLAVTCFNNKQSKSKNARYYEAFGLFYLQLFHILKDIPQDIYHTNYLNKAIDYFKLAVENYEKAKDFSNAAKNYAYITNSYLLFTFNVKDAMTAENIICYANKAAINYSMVNNLELAAKYFEIEANYFMLTERNDNAYAAYKEAAIYYEKFSNQITDNQDEKLKFLKLAADCYEIAGVKSNANRLYRRIESIYTQLAADSAVNIDKIEYLIQAAEYHKLNNKYSPQLSNKYQEIANKYWDIIKNSESDESTDDSNKIKAQYHQQAGYYFRLAGQWEQAFNQYKLAQDIYSDIISRLGDNNGDEKHKINQLVLQAKSEIAYIAAQYYQIHNEYFPSVSKEFINSTRGLINENIKSQIDYLNTKLNDKTKEVFQQLLDLSKVDNSNQEFTFALGDADGSITRILLAALRCGMLSFSAQGLDILAEILNQESATTLKNEDLKGFQQNGEIRDKLAQLKKEIVYSKGIHKLVCIGDIFFDRLSNYLDLMRETLDNLHNQGAIFILGNHDSIIAAYSISSLYQSGYYAQDSIKRNVVQWAKFQKRIFVNACLINDKLFIHNGIAPLGNNQFDTAFGIITAQSAEELVEKINNKRFISAEKFTNIRFSQDKLPKEPLFGEVVVVFGHDGNFHKGNGYVCLNPRKNNDQIEVAFEKIDVDNWVLISDESSLVQNSSDRIIEKINQKKPLSASDLNLFISEYYLGSDSLKPKSEIRLEHNAGDRNRQVVVHQVISSLNELEKTKEQYQKSLKSAKENSKIALLPFCMKSSYWPYHEHTVLIILSGNDVILVDSKKNNYSVKYPAFITHTVDMNQQSIFDNYSSGYWAIDNILTLTQLYITGKEDDFRKSLQILSTSKPHNISEMIDCFKKPNPLLDGSNVTINLKSKDDFIRIVFEVEHISDISHLEHLKIENISRFLKEAYNFEDMGSRVALEDFLQRLNELKKNNLDEYYKNEAAHDIFNALHYLCSLLLGHNLIDAAQKVPTEFFKVITDVYELIINKLTIESANDDTHDIEFYKKIISICNAAVSFIDKNITNLDVANELKEKFNNTKDSYISKYISAQDAIVDEELAKLNQAINEEDKKQICQELLRFFQDVLVFLGDKFYITNEDCDKYISVKEGYTQLQNVIYIELLKLSIIDDEKKFEYYKELGNNEETSQFCLATAERLHSRLKLQQSDAELASIAKWYERAAIYAVSPETRIKCYIEAAVCYSAAYDATGLTKHEYNMHYLRNKVLKQYNHANYMGILYDYYSGGTFNISMDKIKTFVLQIEGNINYKDSIAKILTKILALKIISQALTAQRYNIERNEMYKILSKALQDAGINIDKDINEILSQILDIQREGIGENNEIKTLLKNSWLKLSLDEDERIELLNYYLKHAKPELLDIDNLSQFIDKNKLKIPQDINYNILTFLIELRKNNKTS